MTWTARIDGVRAPTVVRISVNPSTGKVYAFLNFDRPYVRPPAPKITEADAEAAARALIEAPDAVVTSSDLAIAFDANGVQQLVYEIKLTTTGGFYTNIRVDAASGGATVLSQG